MNVVSNLPSIVLDDVGVDLAGRPILDGVSLSVGNAERVAILGASGCGKTTLLRTIGGLVAPTAGTLSSSFERPGFVFQDPRLLPWRSACDNAALGLIDADMPLPRRRSRAAEMLLRCGLGEDDMGKFPNALSGGMRARVALARALLHEPDVLLFDEPFGSLDIGTRDALQRLVHDIASQRQITMLLVTHDLREAVNLCSRVLVMDRKAGTIIADLPVPPEANINSEWGHSSSAHEMVARLLADTAVRDALFAGQTP